MIINFDSIIVKKDKKWKVNQNSFYWIFMIPILLPLGLWISSLIIDKFGWIKGMFAISFPLLVLGGVIQSKRKIGVAIGGIVAFVIGWFIFDMVGGLI